MPNTENNDILKATDIKKNLEDGKHEINNEIYTQTNSLSFLIQQINLIWRTLYLEFSNELNNKVDNEIENEINNKFKEYKISLSPSEIIDKYDKNSFRTFARQRLTLTNQISQNQLNNQFQSDNQSSQSNSQPSNQQNNDDSINLLSSNNQLNSNNKLNDNIDSIEEIQNDEIDRWYDTIQSFVSQIKQFLRTHDSKPDVTSRSIGEVNYTNFKTLFNEPFDRYCESESIESRVSPVAYLTSIFKIALDVESFSDETSIKLQNRRPDLFELMLNEDNTNTEIKVIQLSNEILQSGISNYLDKYSSDKDIYSVLSKKLSASSTNFYHEKIKNALANKNFSLREIKEIFDFENHVFLMKPTIVSLFSKEQIAILLDYDASHLKEYFDVEDINELKHFRKFLEKAQITSQELESILNFKILNVEINNIDPKNLTVIHLTSDNLFKIHKAICLKKWLDMKLEDSFLLIIHVLSSFKVDYITTDVVESIDYFYHLKSKYGASLESYSSIIDSKVTVLNRNLPNDLNDLLNTSDDNDAFNSSSNSSNDVFKVDDTFKINSNVRTNKNTRNSSPKIDLSEGNAIQRILAITQIFKMSSMQLLSIFQILNYNNDDLKNYQKIYIVEIFYNWTIFAKLKPVFIEDLIKNVPKDLEEISDFVLEFHLNLKSTDELTDDTTIRLNNEDNDDDNQQYDENKISEVFLQLIVSYYKIQPEKIEYAFKAANVDIVDMMTEMMNFQYANDIEDISQSYIDMHHKIGQYCKLIEFLELSMECLQSFTSNPLSFGVKSTELNFESFYALWSFEMINSQMIINVEKDLLTIMNSAPTEIELRIDLLSKVFTMAKKGVIDITNAIGEIDSPQKIYTLYKIKSLSEGLKLPIEFIIKFYSIQNDSHFETIKNIANETINEYSDAFETKRRDILVNFYLQYVVPKTFAELSDKIKTPNDLYECLLIDNQVNTNVMTSRVSSAIASLQQFINGAIIGIEPGQNVPVKIVENWNQNNAEYAVWAANVMLSLYPANYIEPSLRSNKSEFFSKLENVLNQAGLNEDKVQNAVLSYLNDFEKISDLQTISCYCHGVKKNSKNSWSQKLILEKKVYYYPIINGPIRQQSGASHSLTENTMFYSIAISSENWILGRLSHLNSLDFYWIHKDKLQFRNVNNDQKYTSEDKIMINKFSETFDLSEATLYLISQTKSIPTEYYLRTVNMNQSTNGVPNPLAWSDHNKIESAFGNVIPQSMRVVVFGNRVYIMYGEISHSSEKNTSTSINSSSSSNNSNNSNKPVIQESKVELLNLMLGYRTFDGTWSVPQKLESVKINTRNEDEFSLSKSIAFSIGDDKCFLALMSSSTLITLLLDKIMTVTYVDGINSIKILGAVSNSYHHNKIQHNVSSINSDADEIINMSIASHRDGNFGIAQYIQYDSSQFVGYSPIRLNTGFINTLIAKANSSIFVLLSWNTQNTREPQIPNGEVSPVVDFNGANGKYFWELFFHLPFLITTRLKNERNYKEAMRWMKVIFDPIAKNKVDGSPNYWNMRILMEKGHLSSSVFKPTDPDAMAASNPIEYKKAIFYLLLDTILAEADDNYRMLTPDSLNRAKQLYIQTLALLGNRPNTQLIKLWMPITLQEAMNLQNNALTEIEAALLSGDITLISNPGLRDSASLLLETMDFMSSGESIVSAFSSIFRIPLNNKLVTYWDILESRLFNLRNNLSITGSLVSIGLFASPMNPNDLQRARNSGSTLATSRLNPKVPPYRFLRIIDNAKRTVDIFCSFGDRLLGYIETRDSKIEQEMDNSFSREMSQYSINLQEQNLQILMEERKSIEITKQIHEREHAHYKKLYEQNLSELEKSAIGVRTASNVLEGVFGITEAMFYNGEMLPNIFGVAFGGGRMSGGLRAVAAIIQTTSTKMQYLANSLDQGANYQRRRNDWEHTYKRNEKDIEQINNTLAIHELQVKASRHSLSQAKKEQEYLKEKYTFYRKKFTNKELYDWLIGQISSLYFQMYEMALDMCLAAEASYRFESGEYKTKFIQPVSFNNLYKGLTCGEILKINLEQMSVNRWKKYERLLEAENDIYLSELFGDSWPETLTKLKETSEITFEFTEKLFSTYQPGQYYRQIYIMSFNLLTNDMPENPNHIWLKPQIQGRLTQLSNALIHKDDTSTFDYVMGNTQGVKPSDASYLENIRVGQTVNLSEMWGDNGIAGVGYGLAVFDGERYLPFEGTGAVSKWHLVFTNNQKNKEKLKNTVDIMFKLRHTAHMGSIQYVDHVIKALEK